MDRTAFKERLKLYKQAKEQNPLLKYYEFKDIPKYDEGTDDVTFKAQPNSERPITGYNPVTGNFTVGYNPGAGYTKLVADISDMPVLGDAIDMYNIGNALTNKDWLTAGLSAAAILPIVPNNINKLIKESDWNNAINREIEKIFQKDVRKRGDLIDKERGTQLIQYYNQLADKYTNHYEQMPKAKLVDGSKFDGRAQMTITDDARRRFKETGEKPSWGDYVMEVRDDIDVNPEIAQHEIAHFNQYMNNNGPDLNKLPYGTGTKDMVYLNPADPKHSKYFRNIGEQSAYQLTIINEMKRNGIPVNKKNYNKFVKSLDDTDSKKSAVKQFKSNGAAYDFTKMIPLTGVTGAYFMIDDNKKDKSN